ncbi:MAG TPA: ThiF family adenylyltransferase [Candidatus Paceibacterota bacterium]|nr:ThiF family adenylyltransferase [Candidatus Paceibacterota bacterium]
MSLDKILSGKSREGVVSEPIIFDLKKEKDSKELSKLLKNKKIDRVSDDYVEQLREFFAVSNPSLVYHPDFQKHFDEFLDGIKKKTSLSKHGKWAYFPWASCLTHILDDKSYQLVRTARNRNLINADEQDRFYNATIGIAGLSVGNSVALGIVMQGGAKHIKIADHDSLALSNMNRIRAGAQDLGSLKVGMAARQIYEMNPYAKVEIFPDGITKKNIDKFFNGLDIVVDEIDNIAVKYLIREQAKKRKIAVVMAADNGDNAVVDVERYDEKPQPKFFHGRIGDVNYEMLTKLDKFGIGKTITKHVGPENVTERMRQSLLEMGKTIVSWPQLGGAAMINGAAVAYCVRKILNGQTIISNRSLISMDEMLIPGYNSPSEIAKREEMIREFKKIFGL